MRNLIAAIAVIGLVSCGDKPAETDKNKKPAGEEKKPAAGSEKPDPEKPEPAKEKDPVDERGVSKNPEVYVKFVRHMEAVEEAHSAIRKAVKELKDEAFIKEKLKTIVKELTSARDLHYLKDEDKDENLTLFFNLDIDIKFPQFIEMKWTHETYAENFDAIKFRCSTCHSSFREEEE